MASNIGKLVAEVGLDISKMDKGLKEVGTNFEKLSKKIGKSFTAIGAVITGALALATKGALEFDTAMREVNTLLNLPPGEFEQLKDDVLDLSETLGVDAVESTKALYQAISAGVPKDNALEFLAISAKAAIAGVTDTETVVDGLTTVINAFGAEFSDAEKIADQMFATVKGGKTTMAELSAGMFQVAPIAAAMGVSIEEVLGAVTTLTKQGVPTSVAMTQIRQAIVGMAKPTKEMEELLAEIGIVSLPELDEAMITLQESLIETKEEITELTAEGLVKNTDALDDNREAYGETEDAISALTETGLVKHGEALEKNRDKMIKQQGDLGLLNVKMGEFTKDTKASTVATAELRKVRLEESIADLNSEYTDLTKSGPKVTKTQQKLERRLAKLGDEFETLSSGTGESTEKLVALRDKAAMLTESIGDLAASQDAASEGGATLRSVMGEEGLAGTLGLLRTAAGENEAGFAKAMGSVEALGAVLALTGENAAAAQADLDDVTAATGAMGVAFEIMDKGPGRAMEKAMKRLDVLKIQVGDELLPVLAKLLSKVTDIIQGVIGWMDENPKLVAVLVPLVAAVGGLLLVLGPILLILPGIIALLPILGLAFTLLLGPVGLIILAIVGLIAVGVLIWKNWASIMKFAKSIWGNIKAFFVGIFNFFKSFFQDTWNDIKDDFIKLWEDISEFVSTILGVIVGFFKDHWKLILGILFPPVGLALLIVKLWGPMKDKVKDLLGAIVGFFKDNWKKILGILFPPFGLALMIAKIWGPITDKVKDIWDGAVDVVKKAVNKIIDLINKVIDVWNDLEFKVGPFVMKIGPKTFRAGPWTFGTPNLRPIPPLATGGIVTQATNALIGEKGPEAVIPLDRLDQFGGGMQEILVMLDSEVIGRAVGNSQVEMIRVKTGIRT